MSLLSFCDDDVHAQWCFRVVNESGQVILLLSLIAIGREIGREVQVREKRRSGGCLKVRGGSTWTVEKDYILAFWGFVRGRR